MAEKKNPEIRFKGFSDDWEQCEFSEMAVRNSVMAQCSSELPSVEYEDIVSGQGTLNKDVREKAKTKYGIRFAPNDVLFGKLRPYLKNWFVPDFSGVAVGDFWVLQPSETDSLYLYYLIQTPAFQVAVNQSTGTKMPRADWNVVSKTMFKVPKEQREQSKIGQTLKAIDDLITLHQRKYEKLLQVKKAMLEKMFPKDGADVPEIRFKGFTDAWEKRKYGSIFNQRIEYLNPQESNIELWSLTVEKGLTPKTERYTRDFLVTKEDKYKAIKSGDIVYNPMNMTLGAIGYNDMPKTVAVSGYYVTMEPTKNIDGYFIKTLMQRPQSIESYKMNATGSLLEKQRVQYPAFSEIQCILPDFKEQTRIGAFFKYLDHLITLQQQELDKLQNIKNALLDKMFA